MANNKQYTRVVPEVTDLTKKTKKITEKSSSFFSVASIQLNTLFPVMFNNVDTLFIVRTVKLLKNSHFIVDKSFTIKPFFEIRKERIIQAA